MNVLLAAQLARNICVDPMEMIAERKKVTKEASTVSQNDNSNGWEYWTKVYEDPKMRQNVAQKIQNGPSISDMLSSSSLCAAELIFLHVPQLSHKQQSIIRSLICSVVGHHIPMFDILIRPFKWRVRFYRLEDAELVKNSLDGHCFKDNILTVRYSRNQEIWKKFEDDPVTPSPSVVPIVKKRKEEILIDGWTPIEAKEIHRFQSQLVSLLGRNPHGIDVLFALTAIRTVFSNGIVGAALEEWPTALIRLCTPHVRVYGRYATLSEQNNHELLTVRAQSEGISRDPIDSWEPVAPCNIRNEYHLVDYMVAFMKQFGPQHVKVDLPLRLLSRCLPGSFPSSVSSLASLLQTLSPQFILFDDVLYLVTQIKHRRELLDVLKPLKRRVVDLPTSSGAQSQ